MEFQKYLNLIREKLWEGREYGRVSVMIGAGFSRNAKKRSPQIKDFPLWNDLAFLLYKRLYPERNITSTLDPLFVASEFEAVFGRQALDEFIIQNIPDSDYLPSDLHKLLLSLPWADVFTTNYDALLEKTLPYIHNRRYDLVLKIEDISTTKQPRIVKLHGTIPSIRPFIITEEDYRTYPQKFAPFINMVQQSLMENIFCLIGFSGNDPNFLRWIGWVRDNLGDAMPKIYLVGILDISEPQRKVFERKNIIPIDLSPLFPKNKYFSNNLRHYKAIEWFLWYLAEGRPVDYLAWPSVKTVPFIYDIQPSANLPKIPKLRKSFLEKKFYPGAIQKNKEKVKEELLAIYKQWKEERNSFPGWIVLPPENMTELWLFTNNWINYILTNINKIGEPNDLHLLYELNWRLEKCIVPLYVNWIEIYTKIIEKYNPYPKLINIKAQYTPEENPDLDWETISQQWIELVFAIIREAHEDLDEKRFNKWINLIKEIVRLDNIWSAKWYYEKIMFNLFKLNINEVKKLIEEWPQNFDCPGWELKRCAILSEIGELEKAEEIAERVLHKIRSLQHSDKEDLFLLSLEGWTMMLLSALKQNKLWRDTNEQKFQEYYQGRWRELERYRCNPWRIVEHLKFKITSDEPPFKPAKERKKKFDPGEEVISFHFRNNLDIILPAFQFLRMFEEGSLPLKCGSVNMWSESVVKASKWIKPFAPLWALSTFIRTGQDKEEEIDKWFDRLTVASLNEEDIKKLSSIFIPAWKQSIENISKSMVTIDNSNVYQRLFKVLTEIISRFLFRLEQKILNHVFETSMNLYKINNIIHSHDFYSIISNLLKRLLFALPEEDILNHIHELLSLPISYEDIEPFYFINWYYTKSLPKNFDRSSWDKPINRLIDIVKNGKDEARKYAVLRLSKLHEIDALTDEEKQKFAEALWSRLDEEKQLPKATGLYDFAFLKLPEPKKGEAKRLLKKWLLETNIPENFGMFPNHDLENYFMSFIYSSKPLRKLKSINNDGYIEWTNKDIEIILQKLFKWENKLIDYYKSIFILEIKIDPFETKDKIFRYFYYIIKTINQVIYLNFNPNDSKMKKIKKIIEKILNSLSKIGVETLSTLPGILIFSKEKIKEIENKLKKSLVSSNSEVVRSSIEGVFCWIAYNQLTKDFPKLNQELLDEIVNKILARRQPALDVCISIMTEIINSFPDVITENQAKSLCSALEFLIEETEISEIRNRDSIEKVYRTFDAEEIVEYRKLASNLAFVLKRWYEDKSYKVPDILIDWEKRSLTDKLPEIWKIWRKN